MKGFYQKFSNMLEKIIQKDYGVSIEPPLWELPPKQEFGDLSSMVSLKLASKLKRIGFFNAYIKEEITITCTLTGHGLKDPQIAIKSIKSPPIVEAKLEIIAKLAGI